MEQTTVLVRVRIPAHDGTVERPVEAVKMPHGLTRPPSPSDGPSMTTEEARDRLDAAMASGAFDAALREALDTARHITDLHATAIKERDALKDDRHLILVALMGCAEIGAHLRFDAWRLEGAPPWTAWIPGKGRGDGQTPTEAVTSLKADLKARKGKPA